MGGGGVGQVGQGEGREDRSYSLMAPPSASLLTSFFSPQKNSTPGPGWSMSPAPTTWLSSSGTSSAWSSAPSSMASASSSSIPEEFLSPPPQTFGSQLYGGGSAPQSNVKTNKLSGDEKIKISLYLFIYKVVITEEVDIKPVILGPPSPPSHPENGSVENGEDRYICNLCMIICCKPSVISIWQE